MNIHHHLSDALLESYAAGTLSEGWSIAVATHLSLCPSCRFRLKNYECLGGKLLEELPADTSVDKAWEAVRSRLAKTSLKTKQERPEPQPQAPVLPQPLRSYLGEDVDKLKWRALGRGASHIVIPTSDNSSTVRLLKIPAGKPVPEHGHGGRELTLVLSGSFIDGDESFTRGDIEEANSDIIHQPIATSDADCICLAVTDAPLRFRSWIVRLVQPVLGI